MPKRKTLLAICAAAGLGIAEFLNSPDLMLAAKSQPGVTGLLCSAGLYIFIAIMRTILAKQAINSWRQIAYGANKKKVPK